MNKNFSRIITLLRKERNLTQKQAANDLQISPALLSHYEKGIRECGLDFIIKISDYYDVSCDYLLGKTPDRSGCKISVDDIPEVDPLNKENVFKGSVLPALNKKLISNSLNIIFDILQKSNNKELTNEISSYLMVSVYKIFRTLYSSNCKNPQGLFSVLSSMQKGLSDATLNICENKILYLSSNVDKANDKKNKSHFLLLAPEILSENYPLFASSLYNLIQRAESSMLKYDI
ncbi:MAG: hypothetical protein RUMPE_01270 [Eubacteriales bacterium SKADARSKE-1]|nr:hypothetical protein [Eubacteriales bacterium SKADARSKE-1]